MSGPVNSLEQAIAELQCVELGSLTGDELESMVVAVQGLRDRLTVVAAGLLDRWSHSGVWALDGSKSAAARLARETRSSARTAHAELRRARSLASMPATATAGRAGGVSLDQVDLLAAANTAARRDVFVEHEQTLIDTIADLRYREAGRTVRYWCQRADAMLDIDDDTAERQQTATTLHTSTTFDDMVVIDGTLDPVAGAIVTGELDRLTDELRLADLRDGIERTPGQRRAAALVEMATRSATMPAGGRRPKPLFTALVGNQKLAELCELANGTVITPKHLAPFLSDAMLETVLFDGPSTVISVSHKRTFTGALRRAIQVRDRHCQHPSGCDVPAEYCDVDHTVPYSQGGPTSQGNGRIECQPHNRDDTKHDHGAVPLRERKLDRLDEIRAIIRWRMHRDHPDEMRDTA
jgi:Domain of unknown function (DUF222)